MKPSGLFDGTKGLSIVQRLMVEQLKKLTGENHFKRPLQGGKKENDSSNCLWKLLKGEGSIQRQYMHIWKSHSATSARCST